jgi:nitrogen fixation protein FixH
VRFNTKVGDTRTALKATLKDASGNPVDLTDCTVRFKMGCLIDREVQVVDAPGGKVLMVFEAADVAKPGLFRAEFTVTYRDGRVEVYPNSGYITVYIEGRVCN